MFTPARAGGAEIIMFVRGSLLKALFLTPCDTHQALRADPTIDAG